MKGSGVYPDYWKNNVQETLAWICIAKYRLNLPAELYLLIAKLVPVKITKGIKVRINGVMHELDYCLNLPRWWEINLTGRIVSIPACTYCFKPLPCQNHKSDEGVGNATVNTA